METFTVTGGDDDVMVHCTCGWNISVPAGTTWGHLAWTVSQHANTHRTAKEELLEEK